MERTEERKTGKEEETERRKVKKMGKEEETERREERKMRKEGGRGEGGGIFRMTPLGNKSRKTQFSCKVLAGGICIRIGGKPGVYRNPVPYILYRNTF